MEYPSPEENRERALKRIREIMDDDGTDKEDAIFAARTLFEISSGREGIERLQRIEKKVDLLTEALKLLKDRVETFLS